MRIIIFAGNIEKEVDYMRPIIKQNDYIIACDAGLSVVSKLSLKPDLLIGDFDSVEFRLLDTFSDVKKLQYDTNKDFTDLELTFDYCKDLDSSEIVVFGAIGGRIDHTLANIGLLERYSVLGMDIKYFDSINEIFVTSKSVAIRKSKKYFSILPLTDDTVVSIKGTKYKLENAKLERNKTLTISNEIEDKFGYLDIHVGRVLVIQAESLIN